MNNFGHFFKLEIFGFNSLFTDKIISDFIFDPEKLFFGLRAVELIDSFVEVFDLLNDTDLVFEFALNDFDLTH